MKFLSSSGIVNVSIPHTKNSPLPVSLEECHARGWDFVDIVLVTGDAYIDHPSFGIALIGRLLESQGYRVAILSQPLFNSPKDFKRFSRPRLFFGISSGNLDSIVANYSGSGKVRDVDAYSPDGNPYRTEEKSKSTRRRPDRATLLYANLARAAFKNVPIILGGVEASLRRFIHFDYKQGSLRGSVLSDSKSDLLIFGMGEKAVLETARHLDEKLPLHSINGTCERLTKKHFAERFPNFQPGDTETYMVLPSWADIQKNKHLFLDAEKAVDRHARNGSTQILIQEQQSSWVIQHPSYPALATEELDALYELPYTRKPHPTFTNVPAYSMICHSLTIVRGCSGNCSFCAITRHQGPVISSRSKKSIIQEAQRVSQMDDFKGTISDLGGPTANLYRTHCNKNTCTKHDCLFPKICPHLKIDEEGFLDLLKSVSGLQGIKHVFVSSGLRMELLLKTPKLLEKILLHHSPGSMKIAPEHTEAEILKLMHKEDHTVLKKFVQQCNSLVKKAGKKLHLTPYIISAHPGCQEHHTRALVKKMKSLGLTVRQFQDFTPTPGTLATAMFVTEKDPVKGKKIFVAKNHSEKMQQRRILEKAFISRKEKAAPPKNRRKRKK